MSQEGMAGLAGACLLGVIRRGGTTRRCTDERERQCPLA